MLSRNAWLLCFAWSFAACGPSHSVSDGGPLSDAGPSCALEFDAKSALVAMGTGLRISELMSANDGAYVDERGETDDWVELVNGGAQTLSLSRYWLTDARGHAQRLPELDLAPGQVALLWADGALEQGTRHLAMKLDAEGEQVTLWADPCTPIDRVTVPALPDNESYAQLGQGQDGFVQCRYATPARENGPDCAPPLPPALAEDVTFAPYAWPEGWPGAPRPLAINELALRPAAFVEVVNTAQERVELSGYALRLAPLSVGAPYPPADQGTPITWPVAALEPGERVAIALQPSDTAALEASPAFYGVATLFAPDQSVIDRIDFADWPSGAALARDPDTTGVFRFCADASSGAANACARLAQRAIGDHVNALQAGSDFANLARGATEIGQAPVKFIVDMGAGYVEASAGASERNDTVQLLSSERWALHYTFVREHIYGEPALDRCDADQAREFEQGWYEFSVREYFRTVGRRFLLGTLVEHANGLHTVEFASGDVIDAPLMRRAFLAAIQRTPDPRVWSLRPADAAQVTEMRKLEGTLPIVGPNAPFVGLSYQPLTTGEGFGVLRFVSSHELGGAALDASTILITDDVPNDVPLVGGLITEAFQTPLAHVNVLSQARGTPNMALRHAREDARLSALVGKLVRFEVGPQDFQVREATAEEADAFWQARRPAGARVVASSDRSLRELLSLRGRSIGDLPSIGAKAAQFAELYRITQPDPRCDGSVPFAVPDQAFAIPVVHYAEHFDASGARALLESQLADPGFRADVRVRTSALAAVRNAILQHPVEPNLLAKVEAAVEASFGHQRVRFRSSSNTEDLPNFNGAGLHTSASVELGDPERTVSDGLRTVWSSLWNLRAYDEREGANLEQTAAMMGVLVHPAFGGEAAQGVGISRDLLDVTRDDIYYINTQIGEASVTNPAPGVVTEELLYTWPPRDPEITYHSRSSLNAGGPVLTDSEVRAVACALGAVQQHFRPLLDPARTNRQFAMQIEFKFDGERRLFVKQARPQPFGHLTLPADCR